MLPYQLHAWPDGLELRTEEEVTTLDEERGAELEELGTDEEVRTDEELDLGVELAILLEATLEVVVPEHTDPVIVGTWALPEPLLP